MLVLKAPRALPRFVVAGMTAVLLTGSAAVAQHFPAFQQAVAEGVSGNSGLSEFYRDTAYDDLWTGGG